MGVVQSAQIYDESYIAASDLSALANTAVKLSAENTVDAAGAGESAQGILLNAPKSGEEASVRILGTVMVKVDASGAAISVDDPLKVAAGGVLVKATANKDNVAGHAGAALASGTGQIPVLLTPKRQLNA